jgi:hypothetical protein
MTSIVEGFNLKALHVFQVRTLSSMGLNTRVTLSNKSHTKGSFATNYRVDLTVYSSDGKSSVHHEGVACLLIDSIAGLDCRQWQEGSGEDQVMVFHLIPIRLLPRVSPNGDVDVSRFEIWSLFTAQDQYVEYYTTDGFSSGVLYQSGAFNYRKFSLEQTTVIQAPKVFLSSTLNTILSVLHTSFEPNYTQCAILQCALLDESANVVARWTSSIKPFTGQSISLREKIPSNGDGSLSEYTRAYTLLAICQNAVLMPLMLTVDSVTGAFALEHSLPPTYYGQSVKGAVRAQMIADLARSDIFAGVRIGDGI